jgi:hypothetical protein
MGAGASAEKYDAAATQVLAGDKRDQGKFDEIKDAGGYITQQQLLGLAPPAAASLDGNWKVRWLNGDTERITVRSGSYECFGTTYMLNEDGCSFTWPLDGALQTLQGLGGDEILAWRQDQPNGTLTWSTTNAEYPTIYWDPVHRRCFLVGDSGGSADHEEAAAPPESAGPSWTKCYGVLGMVAMKDQAAATADVEEDAQAQVKEELRAPRFTVLGANTTTENYPSPPEALTANKVAWIAYFNDRVSYHDGVHKDRTAANDF